MLYDENENENENENDNNSIHLNRIKNYSRAGVFMYKIKISN